MRLCECGCGEKLKKEKYPSQVRKFIHGHWAKTVKARKYLSQCRAIELPIGKIKQMYADGKSIYFIAAKFGCSHDTVWDRLRASGIKLRYRGQLGHKTGDGAHNWKGDNATYIAFHHRMERQFGKPKECGVCGSTDPTRTYDWANLTGKYHDTGDYQRMCRSCHRKYDNARRRSEC